MVRGVERLTDAVVFNPNRQCATILVVSGIDANGGCTQDVESALGDLSNATVYRRRVC